MANGHSLWLEEALTEQLRPLEAPAAFPKRTVRSSRPALVLAALAAMAVVTVAGVLLRGGGEKLEFACTSASELQSWMKQTAGLNVPLPPHLSPGVQLLGANRVAGGAEIVFVAAGRTQRLLVERGASGEHHFVAGGQSYRIEYANRGEADAACLLCHAGA